MKILGRFHFHPFLIGIFPVFSLYVHNQSQLEPTAPWRSLLVIMGCTVIVLIVLRLFFKDWGKAALITSYASLIFFLYNPLREVLHNIHSANFNLGWNRYFLPLWLLILVLGTWLIVKKIPVRESTTQLFNVVALSTLLLPFVSFVSYSVSHYPATIKPTSSKFSGQEISPGKERPDIYYIILDMYGRSDTIEDKFGYDNSAFLEEMRQQGFYVAPCSTSNYSYTVMSLASSFNMVFLPALEDNYVAGQGPYANAATAIRNNAVRRYLQEYGYSFVSFQSFFPYLDIPESDVYVRVPVSQENIRPFELLLIEQTPVKMFMDKLAVYRSRATEPEVVRAYGFNYDRTLFVLEKLTELPTTVSSPKFVYVHLFIPHPPYVFGANGEYIGNDKRLNEGPYGNPVDEEAYRLGYTSQVRYINSVLPNILKQIISQSETEPIIIVQGDHGFGVEPFERLPILNAYYLPGQTAEQLLYPGITPVNSFRVILNTYFGGQFELLPDEKYPTRTPKDYYGVERMEADAIDCNPK